VTCPGVRSIGPRLTGRHTSGGWISGLEAALARPLLEPLVCLRLAYQALVQADLQEVAAGLAHDRPRPHPEEGHDLVAIELRAQGT
jgi:hypothetical protein